MFAYQSYNYDGGVIIASNINWYQNTPGASNNTAQNSPTIIADPLDQIKALLQSFGLYDALSQKFLASDFPIGNEDEYMRHYLFGIGKPFINLFVFVDVGVGYTLEVDSGDKEKDKEIVQLINDFLLRIDYQTTLIQLATFNEVLGRAALCLTKNLAEDDFYYNEFEGVTGVDIVNPMSLTRNSIRDAFNDKTGKTPFIQKWTNRESGVEETVDLERERVIYTTKNPFTTNATDGVSSFANCINDMRVGARFARYKAQVADKASRLHRHFQVDTDKFGKLKQGKEILQSKSKSKSYLHHIHRMINEMNDNGSDVATMDYIDSKEVTWAGKIPDITSLEKGVFESIAIKMEIPINVMSYGKDVNRNTLEILSDVFVRRRETGSQLDYIRITQKIINTFLEMKGITNTTVKFNFNKFLPDDINQMYLLLAEFASKLPGMLSDTEIRRKLAMPDKIEYGEADDQIKALQEEMMQKQQAMIAQSQNGGQPSSTGAITPSTINEINKLEQIQTTIDQAIYELQTLNLD